MRERREIQVQTLHRGRSIRWTLCEHAQSDALDGRRYTNERVCLQKTLRLLGERFGEQDFGDRRLKRLHTGEQLVDLPSSGTMRMLSGEMSRCTIPSLCTWPTLTEDNRCRYAVATRSAGTSNDDIDAQRVVASGARLSRAERELRLATGRRRDDRLRRLLSSRGRDRARELELAHRSVPGAAMVVLVQA